MSCNGCRVLRKGCSDTCILRSCLQWIESAEAQGLATVFVAKFFGRAGLMGFISAVPENQRPALFQSLLYEACGRTVNPVYGAVGLLWTGNWHICQAAVETVLKGGTLRPAASLPTSTSGLQCSLGMPLLSLHRPKPTALSDETVLTLSSEPSLSTVRCTDISKPKRPLGEHQNDRNDHFLQDKRCRSVQQESNEGPLASRFINQSPVLWVSKPQFMADTTNCVEPRNELTKKEQCQQPSGQLVVPVPMRARTGMEEREMGGSLLLMSAPSRAAQSPRNIELDLTLSSYPTALKRTVRLGDARVSSPISALSVNSEGSVTSLDTADLPISRLLPRSGCPREEHKLLDLLV